MKKLLTLLAVAPLAVTACGSTSKEGKVITIVAEGSVSDGTFNQSVFDGSKKSNTDLERVKAADNFEAKTTVEANLKTALLDQVGKYETLLLPGFTHGTASLAEVAADNKENMFVLYDSDGYFGADGFVPLAAENIATITYKVEQAGWILGYGLATQYEADGKALEFGMFGGMSFPSVYGFMSGVEAGIDAFNATSPTQAHRVVNPNSWNSHEDFYSGNFDAGKGTEKSTQLIDAGANVLMAVAGPQTADAIAEAEKKNGAVKIVGVDVDAEGLYNGKEDLIISSITKELKASTERVLKELYGQEEMDKKSFNKNTAADWASGEIGVVNKANATNGDLDKVHYDAAVTAFGKLTDDQVSKLGCSTTFAEKC